MGWVSRAVADSGGLLAPTRVVSSLAGVGAGMGRHVLGFLGRRGIQHFPCFLSDHTQCETFSFLNFFPLFFFAFLGEHLQFYVQAEGKVSKNGRRKVLLV
jgi:hypothetical protein